MEHNNRYHVVQYTPAGKRIAAMAGMGRHRGTWDADHSRSSAYRHADRLRRTDPAHVYRVEPA